MNEDVRAIVQALALDRAYAIAKETCRGCGLPAVRHFGTGYVMASPWFACSRCSPSSETDLHADRSVATLEDLQRITDAPLPERVGSRIRMLGVRVESTERFYEHDVRSESTHVDGLVVVFSGVPGCAWRQVSELRFEPVFDLPNRKAVERLLRVVTGEPLG